MGFGDVEKQYYTEPVSEDGVETCSEMSQKVQLSNSETLQRQGKRPQLKVG